MDRKINILTYNRPHRKTQDLLFRLIATGHKNINVLVSDWIDRPTHNPIYQHRPPPLFDVGIFELCERLNIPCPQRGILDSNDVTLIAGAGIIPFFEKNTIINSHPGYLPNVRGLDALKWAIYEGQPIGVTTHIISDEVDAGIMIDRQLVPIYFEDTFHSIAQRQYELEIQMLVEAIDKPPGEKLLTPPEYITHKRMPHSKEIKMMSILNNIISKAPNK